MSLGSTLRAAREACGITTSELAARTHMLVQIVEGLENEDFRRIPAPIYGRGFVKLYCETVGLEPKPLVDAFMEIYGGRGTSAANSSPAPVAPPAPKPTPVIETPTELAKPVAPEPPKNVQSIIDFDTPAKPVAPEPAQTVSRYAAPMPADDGFSMPIINWRMVALAAAAIVILLIAILGVRALYRVTMTAPADEVETTEVTAPTSTPTPTPTPTPTETKPETQTPAKVTVDRKPLPLKPFYIDSNHQTETEK